MPVFFLWVIIFELCLMIHSLSAELPEMTDQEVFMFCLELKYASYLDGI